MLLKLKLKRKTIAGNSILINFDVLPLQLVREGLNGLFKLPDQRKGASSESPTPTKGGDTPK